MKKILVISLLLFVPFSRSLAQDNDTLLVHMLIKDLATLQVISDKEFYPGSFSSFRESAGFPHNYQRDNNAFFTAISIFTLQNMLPNLRREDKKNVSQVIKNALPVFRFYRNSAGLPFYNFWPTGKSILPHTFIMKHFNKLLGMGEDADDAVMILMAMEANDSTAAVLKHRMIEVSNLSLRKIKSTFSRYRQYPAYSTYLGLHMLPDFDFGVSCNILYFMLSYKMPLVKQDSATIRLVSHIIKDREYLKSPAFISPYYARPPVLLYHIARLMGRFQIAELETYRARLIADMQEELNHTKNLMDKVILSTSLRWMGQSPPLLDISGMENQEKKTPDKFIFFQARAAFWYPSALKKIFLKWNYLNYYFYSPAYNKVLLLEYLLSRNSTDKKP